MEVSHGSVKFGTSFVEGIKHTLGQAYDTVKENIPIVGQVEEFYAGSADREQARLKERGFTQKQIDEQHSWHDFKSSEDATTQFLDTVSDATNINRDLVGAGAFALETLVDARAGGRMAVKTASGAVRLMDAPVAYAGKDLPRPGSRGRYLTQGEFDVVQPQRVRDARDVVTNAQETVQNIEEANPNIPKKVLKADGKSGYKSAVRKKEDGMAAVSSEESNILTPTPDNQYAFPRDSPRAKEIKARVFKENEELGRAVEQLEMHHLFPKGISAGIYNRVRDFIEVGNAVPGDLTRIARKLKKATGLDTGDLETNIEAMRKTPHSTFHNEMRYQPSATFKGQKLEISKEKLTTELRKVKNLKDLEVLLDTFLEKDIIPLIKNAKIWENMDDAIMSVSPKYTGKAKYKP